MIIFQGALKVSWGGGEFSLSFRGACSPTQDPGLHCACASVPLLCIKSHTCMWHMLAWSSSPLITLCCSRVCGCMSLIGPCRSGSWLERHLVRPSNLLDPIRGATFFKLEQADSRGGLVFVWRSPLCHTQELIVNVNHCVNCRGISFTTWGLS